MRARRCLVPLAFFPAALVAGCTVGPDFHRPAAPVATAYRAADDVAPAAGAAPQASLGEGPQAQWWRAFGSDALDQLVDQALAHNESLAASDATLAAAQAQWRAVLGRRAPQIDANARAEQQQVNLAAFGFGASPALGLDGNPDFHLYSVGGGISYDLDLFGGLKRQAEQSGALALAQQRQTEAAHLALAGQVVNQVLTIAAIRSQMAAQQALLSDDARNLDLMQKRQQGGEGTAVEVLSAQAQLAADRPALPALQQQLAQARAMLATLLGMTPDTLGKTDFTLEQFALPAQVPVSLPSALVHKRPDILAAEAQLHAATAEIGVATARLYPNITLGATLEQGAPGLGDLTANAFRGYDIFAGLTAPIFHGGTLKAQREAAVARARAADHTYRQTVLTAFAQVAELLHALDNDAQGVAMQQDALAVADRARTLSRKSFDVGNSGVLQVIDSQRTWQRASTALVQARAQQFLNVARLYVATAGGWVTE